MPIVVNNKSITTITQTTIRRLETRTSTVMSHNPPHPPQFKLTLPTARNCRHSRCKLTLRKLLEISEHIKYESFHAKKDTKINHVMVDFKRLQYLKPEKANASFKMY